MTSSWEGALVTSSQEGTLVTSSWEGALVTSSWEGTLNVRTIDDHQNFCLPGVVLRMGCHCQPLTWDFEMDFFAEGTGVVGEALWVSTSVVFPRIRMYSVVIGCQ